MNPVLVLGGTLIAILASLSLVALIGGGIHSRRERDAWNRRLTDLTFTGSYERDEALRAEYKYAADKPFPLEALEGRGGFDWRLNVAIGDMPMSLYARDKEIQGLTELLIIQLFGPDAISNLSQQ